MHIKTLLTRPAITTGPDTSLHDARALMRRRGVRHLPVVEHGRLVGMLAERDIARAQASTVPELARHDWTAVLADLTVADAMTRHPLTLHPETPVAEAARLARDRGVEAFPVVAEQDVAGVITRGDLLAVLGGLLELRHPTRLGHVLAATSLRAGADRVLGEALRIAAATGAAVTALHVRPARPARTGRRGLEGATAEAVVDVERARRHIADEVDAVCRREQRVHDVRGEVAEGPVAREIARRAEELDSDLIVMGAAGRPGRLLGLLEPLAARVARLASCPVLTVPRLEALRAGR
jgi:CBS domain-containing protein/nucleotide-binding universal stress UspA family protein